jgi:hypothetical protein
MELVIAEPLRHARLLSMQFDTQRVHYPFQWDGQFDLTRVHFVSPTAAQGVPLLGAPFETANRTTSDRPEHL